MSTRQPSQLFMVKEVETGSCGPVFEAFDMRYAVNMLRRVWQRDPDAAMFDPGIPHQLIQVAYVDEYGQLSLDVPSGSYEDVSELVGAFKHADSEAFVSGTPRD